MLGVMTQAQGYCLQSKGYDAAQTWVNFEVGKHKLLRYLHKGETLPVQQDENQ